MTDTRPCSGGTCTGIACPAHDDCSGVVYVSRIADDNADIGACALRCVHAADAVMNVLTDVTASGLAAHDAIVAYAAARNDLATMVGPRASAGNRDECEDCRSRITTGDVDGLGYECHDTDCTGVPA